MTHPIQSNTPPMDPKAFAELMAFMALIDARAYFRNAMTPIQPLRFDSDGEPINRPTMTPAQEIGWHRAQIEHLESLGSGNRITGKSIAFHQQEISRLAAVIAGEVS